MHIEKSVCMYIHAEKKRMQNMWPLGSKCPLGHFCFFLLIRKVFVVPPLSAKNNDYSFSLEKNIATDFCEEYQVFSSSVNTHLKYQQFLGSSLIFTKFCVEECVLENRGRPIGGKKVCSSESQTLPNALSRGAAWHEVHHLDVVMFIWQQL